MYLVADLGVTRQGPAAAKRLVERVRRDDQDPPWFQPLSRHRSG
jgi:hypothetical protein